jgi:hypothetical protein
MEERENVDREGFLRLVLNLKKKHEREEGNYYKDSFGLLNFYLYYLSFFWRTRFFYVHDKYIKFGILLCYYVQLI